MDDDIHAFFAAQLASWRQFLSIEFMMLCDKRRKLRIAAKVILLRQLHWELLLSFSFPKYWKYCMIFLGLFRLQNTFSWDLSRWRLHLQSWFCWRTKFCCFPDPLYPEATWKFREETLGFMQVCVVTVRCVHKRKLFKLPSPFLLHLLPTKDPRCLQRKVLNSVKSNNSR